MRRKKQARCPRHPQILPPLVSRHVECRTVASIILINQPKRRREKKKTRNPQIGSQLKTLISRSCRSQPVVAYHQRLRYRDCAVYVGNLDERVSERVLYVILIQAGRIVDLHVPKDRETDKPKGYAFAEYESEEIANYAVKLFSGLVTLYSRTLKFAISGQDKVSVDNGFGATHSQNQNYRRKGTDRGDNYGGLSASYRFSTYSPDSSQASFPLAMTHENLGHRSRSDGAGYEYSQRVLGGTLDSINPNRSRRHDSSNSVSHSSH